MPTLFRNLFDSIISALGGGFDKPPQPPAPETRQQQSSVHARPADPPVNCCVCRVMPVKPEYLNEYCSDYCIQRKFEQDLADRMDAWHDQFQERFGDD
ncbi:MAG TPA: hypothetical protein VD835_04135 [Pyrinomonadaceae bacterium]|nr:hypothetical protein [Pyrinomonadaceae bacterium]